MDTIRFDDVEKLRSKISQEYGSWCKPIEISQQKINQFADVTGDHQWIHIDIERAKRESPFKGPVAHGFLTLSLIPALEIPRDWNVTSFRSFVNYARTSSAYSRPSRQAPRSMRARVWSQSSQGRRERKSQPRPWSRRGTQDKRALIYEGIFCTSSELPAMGLAHPDG
jgi:hypothetical protein